MSGISAALGDHASFIVAAYALAALTVAWLVLRSMLDHRSQRAALARLESLGVRRRSESERRSAS